MKRLLLLKKGYIFWDTNNKKKNSIYFLLKILSKFANERLLKNSIERIIYFENSTTEKVVNYGGAYTLDKESISIKHLSELKELAFEDAVFPVPSDWNEVLSNIYGDYYELPPENERGDRHSIIKVKL